MGKGIKKNVKKKKIMPASAIKEVISLKITQDGSIEKSECSLIKMYSQNKEVFRIGIEGKVYWLKNGKMVQAKTDKHLAQAFALGLIAVCQTQMAQNLMVQNLKK